MRDPLYRYYQKYPLEKDTVCAICGCDMKVIIHTTQQQSAKCYCREPCRAKRMAAITVLWAASWVGTRLPKPPMVSQQVYRELLRKSKGITDEAVQLTAKVMK